MLMLLAVIVLLYAFYKWATVNNDYFKQRNVKYMKPRFLVGNTLGIFLNKYSPDEYTNKLYNAFPNEQIYGMFDFRVPQYVIRDPEAFKQIAIKDFDHFEDHYGFVDDTTDRLWGNSLFFMGGERWRQMRATLSPAFTGSKMRQMFELVTDCADDVVKHFLNQGKTINIEMKDFFARYSNDVIATSAFGLKINSFAEPENEFYQNGRKLMDFTSLTVMLQFLIVDKMPAIARLLNITTTDESIAEKFRSTILNTMEVRKKNNIHRPDMINILMAIRAGTLKHQNEGNEKEQEGFATVEESDVGKMNITRTWNDDEIVAQCFIFFAGGFETTSTILTFAAYELATNPDIQQKLYEEIDETDESLNGKRFSYDVLQKMKYLDQVVCETLRKWPPGIGNDRVCTKDYIFDPDYLNIKIEKGTTIFFPVLGMQRDPKYFPNPLKFDPDRFSDENKGNIVSGTYIPFGSGPRNCIGSRFALMQVKAILYYLLRTFSFEPNEKTQIPLKLKKSAFNLEAENGVRLKLKLR